MNEDNSVEIDIKEQLMEKVNEENASEAQAYSLVNPSLFETPVKRIGVSGGTAPFFSLKLLLDEINVEEETANEGEMALVKELKEKLDLVGSGVTSISATKYIGKDLSRARDEVNFYEKLLKPDPNPSREALGALCDFMFSYLGILKTVKEDSQKQDTSGTMETKDGDNELDLLVLENLFDGKKKLRLLDLKIGSCTASAGWQGKGHLRAFKQQLFDKTTNSVKEGYRLEGFDGCPDALKSIKPFVEQTLKDDGESKFSKKSRRLLYQHLQGRKIFQYLLDIHNDHENTDLPSEQFYDVDEYLEITMDEIMRSLTKLAIACWQVKIPQKWIGSSLAIGFDAGEIPQRSETEASIRDSSIVRIFDWGRSELNNSTQMEELTKKEVEDREFFWNEYKSGISTISWIATQIYKSRFCCPSWKSVSFDIYDHDTLKNDDFLCGAEVPMEETESKSTPLLTKRGRNGGSLTYSIRWIQYEENSRLKGAWKIKIEHAKNIPNSDFSFPRINSVKPKNVSDPYVIVRPKPTETNESSLTFDQHTNVIEDDLNPIWNEIFSIPVSREDKDHLKESFEIVNLSKFCGDISVSKEEWVERVKSSY
jgi:hypothetical protein